MYVSCIRLVQRYYKSNYTPSSTNKTMVKDIWNLGVFHQFIQNKLLKESSREIILHLIWRTSWYWCVFPRYILYILPTSSIKFVHPHTWINLFCGPLICTGKVHTVGPNPSYRRALFDVLLSPHWIHGLTPSTSCGASYDSLLPWIFLSLGSTMRVLHVCCKPSQNFDPS